MTATRSVQRTWALERANAVRLERSRLIGGKQKQPCGRVADLLEDPPEALLEMRIDLLLARARHFGLERVRRLLAREEVSEGRLVRQLSERQRRVIAGRLRDAERIRGR